MAITRYVGDRFAGLSTDSKPTNVIEGALFLETNTGTIFFYNGTAWEKGPKVSNLDDVDLTSLASGNFLSYNGTDWINKNIVLADINDLGDLSVADLNDITITTPALDEVLSYDGTKWVNVDLAAITSNISVLDDLIDVTVATPVDRHVLLYDGVTDNQWENRALVEADISDLGPYDNYGDWNLLTDGTARADVTSGANVNFVGGTNVTVAYSGTNNTVTISSTDTNTQLSEEEVQDFAWNVLTGTQTLITVTYDDVSNNVSFVVNNDLSLFDNTNSGFLTSVNSDSTMTGDGATTALSVDTTVIQAKSERNQPSGYVGLDASSKISSSFLPALALTDVFTAADITARDALVVGTGDGEVQEGDVVVVLDASADADVPSGSASYIWDGTQYQLMGTPDISAAGANTQIQFNSDGDFGASTSFTFNTADNNLLNLTGNLQITENVAPTTPANNAAVYFVETVDNGVNPDHTFVKVRLGNGDDAIIASYVQ